MKKVYITLLIAIVAASCSKNIEEEPVVQTEATFTDATITRVLNEQWRPYDQIGIFAFNEMSDQLEYSNILYRTASLGEKATFVAADSSIYYPNDDTKLGFVAYSPYHATLDDANYLIDISENQASPELIDLLCAKTDANYSNVNADVQLTFRHILAKVSFKLQAGEGFEGKSLDDAIIIISGVAPTGVYNILDDKLSVGDQDDTHITIRTVSSGELYEAILIPDSGVALEAQIVVDGTSYPWSISDLTLESGEEYSYTLTLDEQGISVSKPSINSWVVGQDDNNSLLSNKFFDISFDGEYYNIYTAEELHAFANLVNGNLDDLGIVREGEEFATFGQKNSNLNARLMSNIDLQGSESNQWPQIGTLNEPYSGIFNGNNKSIEGVYINYTGVGSITFGTISTTTLYTSDIESHCGFINTIGGNGAVINLTIDGSVTSDADAVGAIIGRAYSGGEIENCTNRATVNGKYFTGGIIGCSDTVLEGCYNEGNVRGNVYIGGVCGYFASFSLIYNCHNSGSVIGDMYSVGGITGYSNSEFRRCTNVGDVSGVSDIGGICGKINKKTIYECHNSGKVSGENSGTGGIVGSILWGCVQSSYNTGEVIGVYSVGGITGTCTGSIYNCYNRGSITGYYSVGGILGYYYDNSDYYGLSNCYNTAEINGSFYIGGILGSSNVSNQPNPVNVYYLEGLEVEQTYGEPFSESFMKAEMFMLYINDGQTAWEIDDANDPINDGFPILIWQ